MSSRTSWFSVGLALAGMVATLFLVRQWTPEGALQLPRRDAVANRAEIDVGTFGYQAAASPLIQVSTGPRPYSSTHDQAVLLEQEPDLQRRRDLLAAAPPVRLAARFVGAIGADGYPGELLLEYDGDCRLIGASFGFDGIASPWVRTAVRTVLAGRLSEALLGEDPPLREEIPPDATDNLARVLLGPDHPAAQIQARQGTLEALYRPAERQGSPGSQSGSGSGSSRSGLWVYLGADGSWAAQLQAVPYYRVTRCQQERRGLLPRARYYAQAVAWLLALVLAWRSFRRTRSFGRAPACAALLVIGLLPLVAHLHHASNLVVFLSPFVVAILGVLVLWFLAESTLREVKAEAVEHWDRLILRRPLAATGNKMLYGAGIGSLLSCLLAGTGAVAAAVGPQLAAPLAGGYHSSLLLLPDYHRLPSTLNLGIGLTAGIAALVAVGRRLGGTSGTVVGAALSALLWAAVIPAAPAAWPLAAGLMAAALSGWLFLRHGLLSLLVASVTAVSLPTACIAWRSFASLSATAAVAAAPLLLLALGVMLARRAPLERPDEGQICELKTLLICDLVDSTTLVRSIGDSRAAELFAHHDRLARELLRDLGGKEIDKTDGFLLLFDRPLPAIKYALAYHRELKRLSEETEIELSSRVGIHFGEVFLHKNTPEDVARGAKPLEVEGLAKPIAARLMSLARPRQTLLTRAVYDLARRAAVSEMDVAGDLEWREHGKYLVKGMDEEIEVFEVGVKSVAPLAAPESSDKAWRIDHGSSPAVQEDSDKAWRIGYDSACGVAQADLDRRETIIRRRTTSSVPVDGSFIGHYRTNERLGKGGMGEVIAAEDTRLGRKVAIKALPAELETDQEALQRFEREARVVAALDHPNIVSVYSVEEHGGRRYLIMELIEGRNLEELIASDGMPHQQFFDLAIPLTDALATAHAKGITHRDLKPTNIMVGAGGKLKVLDFGLAKVAQQAAEEDSGETTPMLTSTGQILGTMPYMSPEQVRGKPVDHRSDVFSLGIVFYEMLTGVRPFLGETPADLITTIVRDAPPELMELRGKLPRPLRLIIRRCLEKAPADRYQTVAELQEDLKQAMHELDAAVRRSARRRRLTRRLTAAAVMALLVGGGYAVWRHSDALLPHPGAVQPPQVATAESRLQLAVLPFTPVTAAEEDRYLAQSLAAEVAQGLSRLRDAQAAPTTAVLALCRGGREGQETAARHGAEHLLLGELRRSNGAVVVAARLVRSDGTEVWAQTIEEAPDQMIGLQHRLVTEVAAALALQPPETATATDDTAYRQYLRALFLQQQPGSSELAEAGHLLSAAVAADPQLTPAWIALANNRLLLTEYTDSPRRSMLSQAAAAVERALAQDSSSPPGRAALGGVLAAQGEHDQAERELRLALNLDPWLAPAHRHLGRLLLHRPEQEKREEGLALLEKASQLDPYSLRTSEAVAAGYLQARLPDRALATYRQITQDYPGWLPGITGLARAYLALRRTAEAAAVLDPYLATGLLRLPDQVLAAEVLHLRGEHSTELQVAQSARWMYPDSPVSLSLEAVALAAIGETEEALQLFDRLVACPFETGSGELLLDIAHELRAHGHHDAACRLYYRFNDWFHSLSPDELAADQRLLLLAAEARLAAGDLAAAAGHWRQVLELETAEQQQLGLDQAGLTALTAAVAAVDGNREEAGRLLQELAANPDLQIGVAVLLGEPDRAVAALREAVAQGMVLDRRWHASPVAALLESYLPYNELVSAHGQPPQAAPEGS